MREGLGSALQVPLLAHALASVGSDSVSCCREARRLAGETASKVLCKSDMPNASASIPPVARRLHQL